MFENNPSDKNFFVLILFIGLLVTFFNVLLNVVDLFPDETLPPDDAVESYNEKEFSSLFFSAIENGDCYEAQDILEKSKNKGWEIKRGNELGRCFYESGELDVAKGVFLNDIDKRENLKLSTKAEAHMWVANIYVDKGRFEDALERLDKVEELDVKRPDFYDIKGVIFYEKGEFESAENNFEKAINLYEGSDNFTFAGPEDLLGSKVSLGWALFKQEEYESSKSIFKEALEYYDKEIMTDRVDLKYSLFSGLGWNYLMNEEFNEAIEYFDRIDPDYFEVHTYMGKGWSYLNIGEDEKAKECFENALEIAEDTDFGFPSSSLVHGGLIFAEQNLGNIDRAQELENEVERIYGDKYSDKQEFP